jgi:hypothetical protein
MQHFSFVNTSFVRHLFWMRVKKKNFADGGALALHNGANAANHFSDPVSMEYNNFAV